jgi:EAL domain-containing protein (putative c-di-GMP-specific phosphodiesterase class I)
MSAARNALTIVDEATRQQLGWEFAGINISSDTLLDPGFDQLLARQLGQHVVIELSDQRQHTDWVLVRRSIDRIRELGCRIAVNSMTNGPSAQFERLLEVAPEIVKLDIGFTSTLVDNYRRRGAAEDLLRKCIQRGVFLVAVGVEHDSDVAILAELGVDAAQGYVFGKPQSIECFEPAMVGLGLDDIVTGVGWT